MPTEVTLFLQLLREQGVGLTLAITIVTAWLRGWVVSAATHKEIVGYVQRELDKAEDDRDWWRRAWEQAANTTLETQEVTKEILRPGSGRRRREDER